MMGKRGSLKKLKSFSQRLLRPVSPAPEEDFNASSSSFKLTRRNSVTEFNLGGQLPVYDSDTEDDDGSMVDVAPVKTRRDMILIRQPSSKRILDMELPSPPQKTPKKPPLPKMSSSKTRPRLPSMRAQSERNLFANSNDVAIMPPPLARPRPSLPKSESFRSVQRRNSITMFNLEKYTKTESDKSYESLIMRTQTQSHRDKRSVHQYMSPTKSSSHRHNRCIDRKAKHNRKLACIEMSGNVQALTSS